MNNFAKSPALCIITEVFYPGYKAGGPVRSCVNLALALEESCAVYVLTADRDLHAATPYSTVPFDRWHTGMSRFQVRYSRAAEQGFSAQYRILKHLQPEAIYLNSMFSSVYAVFPFLYLWSGRLPGRVVLAPRGMLKASALRRKPFKKKLFLGLFKLLRLPQKIVFHATSPDEAADIIRAFGKDVEIHTLPVLPDINLLQEKFNIDKKSGSVRLCFIGRIHPIKNLHLLLELLISSPYQGHITLDIIGPEEIADYAQACRQIAANCPANITIRFVGECAHESTLAYLQEAHFFVLLSAGENFGHSIFEALALSKPVIISDQTPWRRLADQQAGWDLSLQDPTGIRDILKQVLGMDNATYQGWSAGAYAHARAYVAESDWIRAYMELFFPHYKTLQPV